MTPEMQHEMGSLANYKACEMSDDLLVICHYTARREWDRVAERLLKLNRNANILAGYVGQLIPVAPLIIGKETQFNAETTQEGLRESQ